MRSLVAASRWIMDLGPHLLIRTSPSDERAIRRAVRTGRLIPLAPGRYLRDDLHSALDADQIEIMRIIAVVSHLRRPVVVSHASAAILWGLPRLRPTGPPAEQAPPPVDVIDPTVRDVVGGRFVRRRPGRLDAADVVLLHGVAVTNIVRTVVDLATRAPFRPTVMALDHGLRVGLFTKSDLFGELESSNARRGRGSAARAIAFADGRANRPGESLSRCVMHEIGAVPPELQQAFRGPGGQRAEVDFWWEGVGGVGEFDGKAKYVDAGRWSGLDAAEVVVNEKVREDWIRGLPEVLGFTRWIWSEVTRPGDLERKLRSAGVPFTR